MPLYNINIKDNPPMIDKSHLRKMWSKVIMYANMFHMENGRAPRIYVSTEAFDVICQSTSFSYRDIKSDPIVDYKGHFMGWDMFISNQLVDGEYVLGTDENEIKICKRKYKLKKIVEKMTK